MTTVKQTALVTTLVLCLPVSGAEAYTAFHNCDGVVNWTYAPNIDVDSCTIPSGSAPWNAINAAVGQWANVYNSHIGHVFSIDHSCSLTYGDGINEIMLVNQSVLGSNVDALTTCQYSTCFFSHGTYTECDIITSNALSYSPEDESFFVWSTNPTVAPSQEGTTAITHELGHFIGLGHAENFNIMRAVSAWPLAGENTAEPYPDDANGARWLYPTSANRTNVFASAEQWDTINDKIVATDPGGSIFACRGQQIGVTFTVGNPGNTAVNSVGFRVYLSTSPTGTAGTDMVDLSATSPAGTWFTETHNLTIPNVVNGAYFILWQEDSGNAVSELNENDNVVHSAMTVIVSC